MERTKASQLLREELDKNSLSDWKVRITSDPNVPYLGLCSYKDKAIIINAHHVDIHPDLEVIDTIKHEVAHALTKGHGHDEVWRECAKKLGCTNTLPCSHLNLPEHIIDAIRSGATVEMEVEEETIVIRTPKYKVTRLQDHCPTCGKVAKEKFSFEKLNVTTGNMEKWITLDCFHVYKKVIPRGTPFETIVSNSWKPEIKNCKHEWGSGHEDDYPKTQCKICNEYKLFKFQVDSCRFTESGLALQKGVLNAHDMGLGKTVIALSLIKFHPEYTPTLYIVKSKTKFQWLKEIMRWIGPSHLGQIISTSKDTLIPGFKSYIVSYDLLRKLDRTKIEAIGIKLVILDECQQIKNVDSGRTQQVRKIVNNPEIKIIGLSGTPWKNRGEELFPILNMLSPTKFHSQQAFLTQWVDWYMHGNVRKQGGIRNIPKFKEYTKDLITRYEFDEVMEDAPSVKRMKLPVQLDEIAQEQYDDATSDFVDWYNQHLIDGTDEKLQGIELLAQMARMRHITGLAKIAATLEFCEEFYENTDRSLVIFVHHNDVGYHLVQELRKMFKDKPEVVIDTLSAQKTDIENNSVSSRFNTDNKRWFIVASTLACGEGIDGLQKGWDSVLHERQWNPQNEDQATPGRFKRIGQKSRTINITCVEADETIDQDLNEIVETKRKWFHELMNKGEQPKWDEGELAKELASRIVTRWKKKGKSVKNKNIKQLSKPVKTQQFDTNLGIGV